jgi:hypothetical protein
MKLVETKLVEKLDYIGEKASNKLVRTTTVGGYSPFRLKSAWPNCFDNCQGLTNPTNEHHFGVFTGGGFAVLLNGKTRNLE